MKTTDKFVFFWGKEDIYSNFYYSPFKHQGIVFKWSEQAIMYRKAMLFGATQIAQEVLKAQTPKQAKDLGRSRKIPFDNDVWEEEKMNLFKEVLLDKFYIPKLKKQLLDTENLHLAEASPFDKIWGIGLAEDHKDAQTPSKWLGLNLLGEVLMEVRDELGKKSE